MRVKRLASKDYSEAGRLTTGLHGANRLEELFVGSNCFWKNRWRTPTSSKHINQFEIPEDEISEVIAETLEPLNRIEGKTPLVVSDLRTMMQNRSELLERNHLEEALKELDDLESRSESVFGGSGKSYNPGWHQSLEIKAMIDVSGMCTCLL